MLRKTTLTAAAILCALFVYSQSFMMQAWYWDYPKPGCNNYSGNSWASTLNAQAGDMSGFSYLWLPPFSRASFGSCSNGYDPQDLYDLGEYGQGATGFGTRVEIMPNPPYDVLNIAWENNQASPVRFKVFNALGELIFEQGFAANAGRNTTVLNVSDWPAGTYFIMVANERGFGWKGRFVRPGFDR